MLARSFLSADDLGISNEWRSALILVLEAMERGEFIHQRYAYNADYDSIATTGMPTDVIWRFNMNVWRAKTHRGVICNIGGAAEILGKTNMRNTDHSDGMRILLRPYIDCCDISVERAMVALHNYLTTGNPNWTKVTGQV